MRETKGYWSGLRNRLFKLIISIFLTALIYASFIYLDRDEIYGFDRDFFAGVIFIIMFTAGLLFYYIIFFKKKIIHKIEFILVLGAIFLLTITLFAVIYSNPSENSLAHISSRTGSAPIYHSQMPFIFHQA